MPVKKHITLGGTACKLSKMAYKNMKDMNTIVDTHVPLQIFKKLQKMLRSDTGLN